LDSAFSKHTPLFRMCVRLDLSAAEADRADELLEKLDHFRPAGNFSIQKRTHRDNPKMPGFRNGDRLSR
jgi:hypothetical protein